MREPTIPLFVFTLIGMMACPININLAQRVALIKAKPKINKGMGLSSKEVAARNAKAQNQTPKYRESCRALAISSLAFTLKLREFVEGAWMLFMNAF
jgi:hypothetical protein